MVLNVGLVSAVLLAKKHNGYRTRLDNLQAKYKKKPPITMNLYQIPLKYIIFIVMILTFIFGLSYLLHEFSLESHNLFAVVAHNQSKLIPENITINNSLFEHGFQHLYYQKFSQNREINHYYSKNYKLINIIYAVQVLAILCILLSDDFEFRKIIVTKKIIYIDQFSIRRRHKLTKIVLKDYNNIDIRLIKKGYDKFTHKNQNFYVILEAQHENKRVLIELLKRGDVYHGRKALVQICAVLGIAPNLTLKKYRLK